MKYIFFIALLAMVGLSAASVEVQIINPEDGARIELGSTVVAGVLLEIHGEENISARMLVDGDPTRSLTWRPTTEGEYVLIVQVANNPEFVGAASDFVVVTVYEPERSEYASANAPLAPGEGIAPPSIPMSRHDGLK